MPSFSLSPSVRVFATALILALSCATSFVSAVSDDACVLTTKSATYNLAALSGEAVANRASDRDPRRTEFLYAWSVCHDVAISTLPNVNKFSKSSATLCKDKTGAAFQVTGVKTEGDTDNQTCKVLGTKAEMALSQLVDGTATGVTVKYSGGESCGGAAGGNTFSVHYHCNQFVNSDLAIGTVLEKTTCDYHVNVQSVYGCPTQCYSAAGTAAGKEPEVCGGHGICSVDPVLDAARCYCNDGYRGPYCTSRVEALTSATPVLMGLVVTLLLMLMGAIALLVQRTRKLTSPQHLDYAHMDDDGTLAVPAGINSTEPAAPAPKAPRGMGSSISIDL